MSDPTHRRDFVRAIALGGAATALGKTAEASDDPPKQEPPKERTEVDARMDLILARYGAHLDEDARISVRREVESIVRRGAEMRKFALTNGDEPFPVFHPFRAPQG